MALPDRQEPIAPPTQAEPPPPSPHQQLFDVAGQMQPTTPPMRTSGSKTEALEVAEEKRKRRLWALQWKLRLRR